MKKTLLFLIIICFFVQSVGTSYALRPIAQANSDTAFYLQGFDKRFVTERDNPKRSQTHFNRYSAQTEEVCNLYDKLSHGQIDPVVIWYLGASKMYDPLSIALILKKHIIAKGETPNFIIKAVEADGKLIAHGRRAIKAYSDENIEKHIVCIHDNFVYPQRNPTLIQEIQMGDIIIVHDTLYLLTFKAQTDFATHLQGVKKGCFVLTNETDCFNMRMAGDKIDEFFDFTHIKAGNEDVEASYLLKKIVDSKSSPAGYTKPEKIVDAFVTRCETIQQELQDLIFNTDLLTLDLASKIKAKQLEIRRVVDEYNALLQALDKEKYNADKMKTLQNVIADVIINKACAFDGPIFSVQSGDSVDYSNLKNRAQTLFDQIGAFRLVLDANRLDQIEEYWKTGYLDISVLLPLEPSDNSSTRLILSAPTPTTLTAINSAA